ncbi:MAG: site-specific integrase, partial [Eubacteriales bacterium]|nr:site-specific integrase [Eubacteriales bacterium]
KRLEKYAKKIWLMPIADIKAIDIKLAIHAMSDAGLSDRTCEMTLIHIRACFEQAVDDKLVRANVAKKVSPPASHTATIKRVKVIPDHIYDQFIAELTRPVKMTAKGQPNKQDIEKKTHRDAIFFMLHTGLREGELRALRWTDIDLKNKTAAIHSSIDVNGDISMTKNEETDIIPLDDEVIAMLQARRFADTGFVFTNRPDRPLNLKNLFDTMRKLMPGYNLHTCRKTFTTRAARSGVDPKVLQSLTRHKSIETLLKHYRAVEMSDKQSAIAKISGYCKSTANPDENLKVSEK